jgi:carbon storage regulator
MMVMRRREGEKILIGDQIVIHIAHIGRNKVKIAIDAPRELSIVAEEMKIVREENLAAAVPLDLNLLRRKIFPQSSPGPTICNSRQQSRSGQSVT